MQRWISLKPGSEIAGMPASETRATSSPRSIRCASSVARAASLPSWLETNRGVGTDAELVEQRAGAARVLAGDEVGADQRLADPRGDVVEVADRRRADDQPSRHQPSPRSSSIRAIAAAPIMPASLPRVASRIGVSFIGVSARSRTSRRAGSSSRSPAAMTPPPTTIASGWKMLAKLEQATPRRLADQFEDADRGLVAVDRSLGHRLAVDRLPRRQQPPEGRVRRAFGRGQPLAPERRPGGERLDAAVVGAVALAGRAVGLDHHVAELGPGAGRAAVDLAAEDQAAADPGADRQHHRVRLALRGAVEVLGEGRDVGVVVDEDRQADPLADQVADRQVGQRQVDRGDRDAACRDRSSPGCRGRPRRRRGAPRAPR